MNPTRQLWLFNPEFLEETKKFKEEIYKEASNQILEIYTGLNVPLNLDDVDPKVCENLRDKAIEYCEEKSNEEFWKAFLEWQNKTYREEKC